MIAESLQTRLLDQLSTAVLILDENLRLMHANAAAELLLGLSRSRHERTPLQKLLLDGKEIIAIMRDTLNQGLSHTQREAVFRTHQGTEVIKTTVDYTVTRLEDVPDCSLLVEIQPVDRLLKINRDASMFSVQQSSNALLKGLAHEIKNPLGGIRGAAQLLEQDLIDEDLKEYTGIIISEADRLRSLVDRILSPAQPKELSDINIHEVLERVRQLIEAEVGDSITIFRDYDPSIPSISAHAGSLIQAFLNLARNAAQSLMQEGYDELYCENSRHIEIFSRVMRHFTIGTTQHRLVCRVDIIDNGPGIPDDIRESIFVPMVSGHAENSGLGLAISQNIINQHHGLITCTSEPGETCFSVFLPLDSGRAT